MAVSPLNNPLAAALGSLGRPLGPAGGRAAPNGAPNTAPQPAPGAAGRPAPAAPRPLAGTPAAGPAGAALPAEPPPGTDPELWGVLTGEERAFFARAASSGPLTYGRISAGVHALQGHALAQAPAAAARGGRLDVRA